MESGLDGLVEALSALGVRHVFGLPGTQNLPLFEAFRRGRLDTVLCSHELGAAFAAVGYARAGGVPGVLATIPGPGFTYALSGIAEARLDSVPLVHLLGLVEKTPRGRFDHQAISHREIGAPLVKSWIEVGHRDDAATAVRDAFRIATDGEPGPVVVQLGPTGARTYGVGEPLHEPHVDGLTRVAERMRAARRPVLFLGQGAQGMSDELVMLAEMLRSPVITTPSGRGVVPESHALCMGFDPDRGGVGIANELLSVADLVFAVGCRMGYNGTAAFGLVLSEDRLVHVNPDRDALAGARPAALAVRARAEDVIPGLASSLGSVASEWTEEEVASWRQRIEEASPRLPEPSILADGAGTPGDFVAALQRAIGRHAIVVTDSGLHQALVRRHMVVETTGGLVVPADFQSMGFGIPAALGAALARPDRRVVAVVGDGGFAMAGMELRTAVRQGVPLVVVVFNDGFLNLIRLQQARDHGATHAVELGPFNYGAFAEAVGAAFVRADRDVEGTLRWAVGMGRPVLVEVLVGDSPRVRALRVAGAVRSSGRRLLGPRLLRWAKQVLRRR